MSQPSLDSPAFCISRFVPTSRLYRFWVLSKPFFLSYLANTTLKNIPEYQGCNHFPTRSYIQQVFIKYLRSRLGSGFQAHGADCRVLTWGSWDGYEDAEHRERAGGVT